MKTILFIRHAKSDWGVPNLRDIDRPLNKRGLRDAPIMGSRLIAYKPDLILLSSAKRTKQTMDLLSEKAGWKNIQHQTKESLYLCSHSIYMEEISELHDQLSTIVFCGHNPTTTHIVNLLAGENIGNIPTCGVAVLQFEIDHWNEISINSGTLIHYDYPKNN